MLFENFTYKENNFFLNNIKSYMSYQEKNKHTEIPYCLF